MSECERACLCIGLCMCEIKGTMWPIPSCNIPFLHFQSVRLNQTAVIMVVAHSSLHQGRPVNDGMRSTLTHTTLRITPSLLSPQRGWAAIETTVGTRNSQMMVSYKTVGDILDK